MSNTQHEAHLPSGAVVILRNLTLNELDIVGNASNSKASGAAMQVALTRVLQSCTVSVKDPGPFPTFSWEKTVSADQIWGLLQLRVASKGPILPYPVRCAACGEDFEFPVNLHAQSDGGDLNMVPVPEETRQAIALKTHVRRTLSNGDSIAIKQVTLSEATKVAKQIEAMKATPVKAAFLARCAGVYKADGTVIETQAAIGDYIGTLDMDSIDSFTDALAEVDGGVDDFVPGVICPTCEHENEVPVMRFFSSQAYWGLKVRAKKR